MCQLCQVAIWLSPFFALLMPQMAGVHEAKGSPGHGTEQRIGPEEEGLG